MESSFTDSRADRTEETNQIFDSEYGMRSSCNDSTFQFENENSRHLGATPFTHITEQVCKPDLAIYCAKCDEYIDVKVLIEHRFLHHALDIFHYNFASLPTSIGKLLTRRHSIITKIYKDCELYEKKDTKSKKLEDAQAQFKDESASIKEVNKCYDFLKALIEDSYESRHVKDTYRTEVSSRLLDSKSNAVQIVAMCTSENKRWKNNMEDRHVYQDCYGHDSGKVYMAVFDGHHGEYTAELSAKELHRLLLVEMAKFDASITPPDVEALKQYNLNCPPRPHTTGSQRRLMYKQSVDIIESIRLHCEAKFDKFMGLRSREQSELCLKRYNTMPHDDTPKTAKSQDCATLQGKAKTNAPTPYMKSDSLITITSAYHKVNPYLAHLSKNDPKAIKTNKTESLGDLSDILFDEHTSRLASAREKKMKESGVPDERIGHAKNMGDAFSRVYHLIDILLEYGQDESSKVRWSGTSAATLVIEDLQQTEPHGRVFGVTDEIGDVTLGTQPIALLHLANAGNVHVMLITNNLPNLLTKDHTLNNPREKRRIKTHGGSVSLSKVDARVNSILATTRGLGNHGDLKLKRCVIPDPYTTSVAIDHHSQILIIASHGLWQVFSEDEVAAIVLKILPCNQVPIPDRIHSSIRDLLSVKSRHLSSASSKLTKHGQSNSYTKIHTTNQCDAANPVHNSQESVRFSREVLVKSFEATTKAGDSNKRTKDAMSRRQSVITDASMSSDNRRNYVAKWMAEDLVQAALLAGAKDNITVMVVLLAGCEV